MENQLEKKSCGTNVKGLIILIGVVFAALTSFVINETFLSIITGAIGGLIFAIFFNTVILGHKEHDR